MFSRQKKMYCSNCVLCLMQELLSKTMLMLKENIKSRMISFQLKPEYYKSYVLSYSLPLSTREQTECHRHRVNIKKCLYCMDEQYLLKRYRCEIFKSRIY